MDGERVLRLHDQPPLWVDECRRMVVALLDVGRVGALHQRDEAFIGGRAEPIRQGLQGDRIGLGPSKGHVVPSRVGLGTGSTGGPSPGNSKVGASSWPTTAGP